MSQLSDTLGYLPKWIFFVVPLMLVGLFILVFATASRTTLTINVSEPSTQIQINDKIIDFVGKEASLQLRPGRYGLSATKRGFEPYFRYITVPEEGVVINIKLAPEINQELTDVLPVQTNARGISLKATKVKYFQKNTWAVATMAQFDVEESQTEQTFAVFRKEGKEWTTILEPASEYFDEEASLRQLPSDVRLELRKRLAE